MGLDEAIKYVTAIGLPRLAAYERELFAYASDALSNIPGLQLTGTASEKAAILSFVIDGIHPHDIGTVLDQDGVAIRAGHHCCQPLMARLGVPATVRASLAVYNTREEIDSLVASVRAAQAVFA